MLLQKKAAQINTRKAILNENFRKAVFSSIPKVQLNSLIDGNESALVCIRNTYTTPEFVKTTNKVTTPSGVTHEGGSDYYQLVDAEMDAINEIEGDDYAKYQSYWNEEEGIEESSESNESTFADRESSYFNTNTAYNLKIEAEEELAAEGVTFPVKVDYLVYSTSNEFSSQAVLLEKIVEETLGKDFIDINIQSTANVNDYENSHFLAPSGAHMNFDLSSGTGWGPDYGDPATFLNTLNWDGELVGNLGFDSKPEDEDIYDQVLGDYRELYEDASNEMQNTDLRYAKLAAAEAELLNSAVIMPNTTDGGGYAVTRIIPRTNQRSFYGTDDSRFKYMVVGNKVLTVTEREQILADWDADYKEIFGSEEN